MDSKNNIPAIILLLSGLLLLFIAILYNEFLLSFVDPSPPIDPETIIKIRYTQVILVLTGIFLISVFYLIKRTNWLHKLTLRESFIKVFLLIFSLTYPIFILELTLKPFMNVDTPTTIFMKDEVLGWKFRPNAEDIWGKTYVKINSKGLRGPALPYTKKDSSKRILYLGDSVTFGYLLDRYQDTFPYITDSILKENYSKRIETINAGIDGYSPWQEYQFLITEGVKYKPDLIVLNFVLNDVTERFGLKRFGGSGEGYQLERTAIDFITKIKKESSIIYFGNKLYNKIRFGNDAQQKAKEMELVNVKDLAYSPEAPNIQKAWKLTLRDLQEIFTYTKAKNIPLLVVVFPFTFQFQDSPDLSVPQKVIVNFCHENEIQVIDLLPLMKRQFSDQSSKLIPEYFLDEDHLSLQGSSFTSRIIADKIINDDLLRLRE